MGGYGSGGSRKGAGRKPIDGVARAKVSVNIPVWLLDSIRDEAARKKVSISQQITDLLTKRLER